MKIKFLAKVLELEGEVEVRKAEVKTLLEDNARWKGRAQQILEKYERIDPVEHQNLKNSVNNMISEKKQALKELDEFKKSLNAQISERELTIKKLEAEYSHAKEEAAKIIASNEKELQSLKNPESNPAIVDITQQLEACKEKLKITTANANEKLQSAYDKLKEARRQNVVLTQVNI